LVTRRFKGKGREENSQSANVTSEILLIIIDYSSLGEDHDEGFLKKNWGAEDDEPGQRIS
jgi:hypothetical protein